MRLLFAFLLLAADLAGFVRMAGAQDCMTKTWKGTIGAVPVMMEFEDVDDEVGVAGRYYYRTSLVDLFVVRDKTNPGKWKELDPKGKVTGFLSLSCREGTLSGTWSSPDGTRTLPVSATETREGESYSGQRLEGLKPTALKPESFGQFHYELITAQGFETVKGVRLLGDSKAIADINSALMEKLKGGLDQAIDCRAWGRWRRGPDPGYFYESGMSIIDWNKAFVVIGEISSQYCGGAHPLYGAGAEVYNLQTGKAEDASQWLADQYREDIPKDSPLGKVLMEIYSSEEVEPSEGECAEAVEFSGQSAWPNPEGMVFRPFASYAATACIQEIIVPYKNMSPFLSTRGKTYIQAFERR